MKKIINFFKGITLAVVSSLILLCVIEIIFRTIILPEESNEDDCYTFLKGIEWGAAVRFDFKGVVEGFGYVEYTTQIDGFRHFGKIDTKKIKLLVLGDSFTECSMISDGETYYDYLGKKFDEIELFVYGCGGYSNIQEYIILDKCIDIIKPDLILWQFCSNDPYENNLELNKIIDMHHHHLRRPYIEKNKIIYKYSAINNFFLEKLVRNLFFAKWIFIKLNYYRASNNKIYDSDDLIKRYPEKFKNSFKTTEMILKKIIKRAGLVPIIAFSVDRDTWLDKHFENVCSKLKIPFIPGIPEIITKAKNSGLIIDGSSAKDYHWNKKGHEIAGKKITNFFKTNPQFLKKITR
ncbi:SGNH/GDSL hydrolase family protein [bacterium]|nr:SGNH/GDSL hydrolase family protein [bacterium]